MDEMILSGETMRKVVAHLGDRSKSPLEVGTAVGKVMLEDGYDTGVVLGFVHHTLRGYKRELNPDQLRVLEQRMDLYKDLLEARGR